MKEYTIDKIRNIALMGHGSTGKTTLSEAMLFSAGETNRFGTIDDGTTISDYSSDEIERKISISASLLHLDWKNTKINILDTPGYFDFIGEVRSGLRAADLAVMLLSGVAGVEVGTDLGWDLLQVFKKPRLFFINHLNREHANFEKVLGSTKESYGNAVVAVNFPANEGEILIVSLMY